MKLRPFRPRADSRTLRPALAWRHLALAWRLHGVRPFGLVFANGLNGLNGLSGTMRGAGRGRLAFLGVSFGYKLPRVWAKNARGIGGKCHLGHFG